MNNNDYSSMTTGEKIKLARKAAGLTQQQLAEAMGLVSKWGQSLVAEYERGRRPIPRKRLKPAAEALGIDLVELL